MAGRRGGRARGAGAAAAVLRAPVWLTGCARLSQGTQQSPQTTYTTRRFTYNTLDNTADSMLLPRTFSRALEIETLIFAPISLSHIEKLTGYSKSLKTVKTVKLFTKKFHKKPHKSPAEFSRG